MSSSYHDDETNKTLVKLFGLSVALVLFMYGWLIKSHNLHYTWLVLKATWPFYATMGIVWAWGVMWWKRCEGFTNPELVFYLVYTIFAVIPTVCMGYLYLTDLGDIEVWNGNATHVVWTEAYYTTSKDKDGNTVYHHYPATYILNTSNPDESTGIDSELWDTYVQRWGGSSRVSTSLNISAEGEDWPGSDHNGIAEEHTIHWDGSLATRVPTSTEHRYVNYLKASDSVLKVQGVMAGWKRYLVDYPRVHGGALGDIYFDRVIEVGAQVPGNFQQVVQSELVDALCSLGAKRKCNIIVYVVGTSEVGAFSAIEEKWCMGKKNDVVVCIGYTGDKIQYCRVLSWTKTTLFTEKLEAAVREIGTLNGKGDQLVKTIVSQVDAPGDAGFVKRSMSELEYLAPDVKMPFWAFLLVSLGGCIIVLPAILLVKDE